MLFTDDEIRFWRISPSGVLHVGGHLGEEGKFYRNMGFGPVIWIEALVGKADQLRKNVSPDDFVINALVWNETGTIKTFNVSNNGQSSSMLEFGTHTRHHPEVAFESKMTMTTSRLDDLLDEEMAFNFVNLDIQGVELEALQGLGKRLNAVDFVYSEVNKENVYEGCSLIGDLDRFLKSKGFKRVATKWTAFGWGDALYIRRTVMRKTFRFPTFRRLYFFIEVTFIPASKRKSKSIAKFVTHVIVKLLRPFSSRS